MNPQAVMAEVNRQFKVNCVYRPNDPQLEDPDIEVNDKVSIQVIEGGRYMCVVRAMADGKRFHFYPNRRSVYSLLEDVSAALRDLS